MGNPTHFSLEVPKRAHQLLRDLYEQLSDSDGTRLPLKATFLLSISMPIVILPIERILKYKQKRAEGHMNDAVLNPRLADAVDRAIDLKGKVHEAKFFTGPWQYATLERGAGFPNLAVEGLPDSVAAQLDAPEAVERARSLAADTFCRILRNALAHGGVLYLDQHGRSNSGAPVCRFAFVSTDRLNNPTKLHFLRIKMADYRAFLQLWVDWLNREAIDEVLAEDLGLDESDTEAVAIPEAAANAAGD
ncbi:hypothetical protein DLJ53_08315 [Acuticoccus sediminis]|uniref:pEK499-p136 HEPN domain-containing protein n=1 Tax=Acuticoccus sediminis TaxID=2184697 RepID=A0A8B2NRA9_9HYPH|nr:hypothetical protein [Acuticoccus sediminis]RAI01431.1 hypothetical protein DLJ53_08315 [Acuticoccus sediminis]